MPYAPKMIGTLQGTKMPDEAVSIRIDKGATAFDRRGPISLDRRPELFAYVTEQSRFLVTFHVRERARDQIVAEVERMGFGFEWYWFGTGVESSCGVAVRK